MNAIGRRSKPAPEQRVRKAVTRAVLGVAISTFLMVAPTLARSDIGHEQRLIIRLDGRSYSLAARVIRPSGVGPFPLVIINHGVPPSMANARSAQFAFTRAAQWFAAHGYMALEVLRPGFGDSEGPFNEAAGPCDHRDYLRESRATATIESAIAVSAAFLPDVDSRRIIILGHSAGGFGAIALAAAPPPGVVGVINVSGGRGSDGHQSICGGAQQLIAVTTTLGEANQLPQLWLTAANDQTFSPALEHSMATAYRHCSKPSVELVDLPAVGSDGHMAFIVADPAIWAPAVSAFLRKLPRSSAP